MAQTRTRKTTPNSREDQEPERLQKVLAQAGLGSRREMDDLIAAGRCMVNGKTAELGQKVGPRDRITVDRKPVRVQRSTPSIRVLIYHKPEGEIVSRDDPEGRVSVFERLPPPGRGRWIAVGRLDYNTSGLLILTTSGELANRMMHPRYGLEREYAVRVDGAMDQAVQQQLLDGIDLDDGVARFNELRDAGGAGRNRWYRVLLSEGRNREVRRMFEAVGHPVSRLIRVRFGPLALPSYLHRGRYVELTPEQIVTLQRDLKELVPPDEEKDYLSGS